MSRAVRAFFVWVMIIAVPVQGMAASAMLSCGPSHERMILRLALDESTTASSHAHGHVHDDAALHHGMHDHAAAADSDAFDPVLGIDADGADGSIPHHGKVSCSVCAACCFVLALPASFELPKPVTPAHSVRMSPAAPVASHEPHGLDRPPRTVLA